jgi:hypothetical protein
MQSVHTVRADPIGFDALVGEYISLMLDELMGDYTDHVQNDSPFITQLAVRLSVWSVNSR